MSKPEIRRRAQIGFGTPNDSSLLETFSTTQGSRPWPTMTEAQRDAISSPAEGLTVFNSDTSKINIYSGSSWGELSGSGGSGGKNYFTGGDFESDISLASTYDDTGAYVDGTGGSPSVITISRNTTTPLEKTADLKITKSASSGSGEGVTLLTGTIDRADRGQNLYLSFEWDGSDANYTDGDYKVHGYSNGTDATELAFVPISGFNNDGSLPAYKTKVYGYFQTSSDTDSTINVSIHLASDSATGSAVSVYVDDAKIGPAALAPSSIVNGPFNFTPSFSNFTLGNGTIDIANYSRDGKFMSCRVRITLGSTSSMGTAPSMTLPGGKTIDSSFLTASNDTPVGKAIFLDNGTQTYNGYILANSSTSVLLRGLLASGTYVSQWEITSTTPMTWATGDVIDFEFSKIPINEWSSGAMLSTTEASLRTLRVIASNSAGDVMTTGSFSDIIYATETKDTHGAYTSGIFTAPFTGDFIFFASGQTESNTANTGEALLVLRDSSDNILYYGDRSGIDGSSTQSRQVSAVLSMNKGDTAKVSFYHTNGANRALVSLASANKLTILGYPDFTHFSVYGETDLKENGSAPNTAWPITFNQWGDLTSIQLEPGTWDISAVLDSYNVNTLSSLTEIDMAVSTYSGNDSTGLVNGDNKVANYLPTTQYARALLVIPNLPVTITSTTTYYLKGYINTNNASNIYNAGYKIRARKIQ